ncbi:hypothetical protein KUV50_05370 [Membranicola marinus]|uniref:Pycsar effector protein domain-containing protein n=1 Tax=Membranihabitans marinus TaxID=1227546 RepID=A0A953L8D3_9BACT|nr:Pycsar system effector family protein [Membranihabitans marinus]MBY5957555.1 hypothetical protein [Membranihabitans marinus]
MTMDETPGQEPLETRFTEELVDHYWGSINYLQGLIRASELKAGLILSFYGILLNFVYQSMRIAEVHHSVLIVLYLLLGGWFICTVTSIYFAIRCFIPRLEISYDKNIFFFKDVISRFGSIKQFSKTFHEISTNEDALFDQLGQQIYIISKIAAVKFKNVHRSLLFLAYGLIALLLIVVYYAMVSF